MAGDWVKVRVWLHKDPKVVSMADYLADDRSFMNWLSFPANRSCKESAYEHVTRNVTCHVTRSALVTLWGVARERGYRENNDLILPHCDIDVLDEISEVPSIGEAMEYVGWAIGFQRDDKIWCVRFPNYFQEEVSPSERHQSKNAERQQRLRERRRNASSQETPENVVTDSNVTVTHREEKSREEKKEENPPSPPAGGNGVHEPKPKPPKWQAEDEPVPPPLDTPEFVRAWADWLAYRREARKRLTPTGVREQFALLVSFGPVRAVESIRVSIRNGWTGLFEPRDGGAPRPAQQKETTREKLERIAAANEARKREGGNG